MGLLGVSCLKQTHQLAALPHVCTHVGIVLGNEALQAPRLCSGQGEHGLKALRMPLAKPKGLAVTQILPGSLEITENKRSIQRTDPHHAKDLPRRHPRLFPVTLQPQGLVSSLATWQEQKQHFSITPAGLLGRLEHHLRALPWFYSPLGQTGRCLAVWRSRTTPSTSRGPSPTAWPAPTSARPPTPSGPGRAWWKSMSQVGKHSACPERGGGGGERRWG